MCEDRHQGARGRVRLQLDRLFVQHAHFRATRVVGKDGRHAHLKAHLVRIAAGPHIAERQADAMRSTVLPHKRMQ